MRKHIIKKAAALAVMGAVLVAGNVSAAEVQDTYDMAGVNALAEVQNTKPYKLTTVTESGQRRCIRWI